MNALVLVTSNAFKIHERARLLITEYSCCSPRRYCLINFQTMYGDQLTPLSIETVVNVGTTKCVRHNVGRE